VDMAVMVYRDGLRDRPQRDGASSGRRHCPSGQARPARVLRRQAGVPLIPAWTARG